MQMQGFMPQGVIGTFRRLGLTGPVYEIVSKERDLPDGDTMMKVLIVETGEEVEHKLTHILDDPAER